MLFVGASGDALIPIDHTRKLADVAKKSGSARVENLGLRDKSHVGMVYDRDAWTTINKSIDEMAEGSVLSSLGSTFVYRVEEIPYPNCSLVKRLLQLGRKKQ